MNHMDIEAGMILRLGTRLKEPLCNPLYANRLFLVERPPRSQMDYAEGKVLFHAFDVDSIADPDDLNPISPEEEHLVSDILACPEKYRELLALGRKIDRTIEKLVALCGAEAVNGAEKVSRLVELCFGDYDNPLRQDEISDVEILWERVEKLIKAFHLKESEHFATLRASA